MKAVFIEQHGDSSVLHYGDRPEVRPSQGKVKVRVRAAALNRLDIYTRQGARGTRLSKGQFPHILGGDCAGDVAELGKDVEGLDLGQRVLVNPLLSCGDCEYCLQGEPSKCSARRMLGTNSPGSYAEYVVVPAINVFPIPSSLGYEEAAALPTVFLPTWSIVVREGQLQPDETALVLSASSGVGTAAIQIIKNVVSAQCIAATSTTAKARATRVLGADHVINYSREELASRVMQITNGRGVDLVVDSVGSPFFEAAFGCLAIGGRYGVCGVTSGYTATLQLGQLFTREQRLLGVFMGPPKDMRRILATAERGDIRSVIHATFPLAKASQAHEFMERNKHFGKIVLSVP